MQSHIIIIYLYFVSIVINIDKHDKHNKWKKNLSERMIRKHKGKKNICHTINFTCDECI